MFWINYYRLSQQKSNERNRQIGLPFNNYKKTSVLANFQSVSNNLNEISSQFSVQDSSLKKNI